MAKTAVQVPGFVVAEIAAIKEQLREYEVLALQIEAAVPHNLTTETDEKAIHTALIKSSERLAAKGVKLREMIGDLSKKFHGPSGSIADQAVQRRKELFAKKSAARDTEKNSKEVEPAK